MKSFIFLIAIVAMLGCKPASNDRKIVILISANAEWRVVKSVYPDENFQHTPWGEFFEKRIATAKGDVPVIFFHEGWGKVAAAGGTQYAIDRWNPEVCINLGTCGGFEGSVRRFETLLIDRAVIYDIKEAMGDSKEAIADYSTDIDLSWLTFPDSIRKTLLVSGDRDLVPEEIESLKQNYGAIAGDWETGAIAYTCKRNNTKLLVLRGVTDLVSSTGGEAYGKPEVFRNGTEIVMKKLLNELPLWLPATSNQ
jgi:adenosylhomocysteine nucleosidase